MKIKLNEVFSNLSLFVVTGFGIGLLPIAPGTFGSMLGIYFVFSLSPFIPSYILALSNYPNSLFFFLSGCPISLKDH